MDDLPRYYILGGRPVKIVETENGGLGVYALSLMTGEFVLAMRYLAEVSKIDRDDVEQVSVDKFNEYVEKLLIELREEKKNQEGNS
jgi:hypothetical protein